MMLNWDAIAAIGEILGAIAVVATLLYLSKQIRQNSMAVQVSAEQWNRWSEILASSHDLAEIVARGNRSYIDLPDADSLRYGAYAQMFFDNAESYRTLVQDHDVDKDMSVIEEIVRRRIRSKGMSEWWDENTADYDDAFVAWINGLRSQSD